MTRGFAPAKNAILGSLADQPPSFDPFLESFDKWGDWECRVV
jgi:hypothetical protein